jgi:sugar O-acyltransferase (sialic acid O-acetyltransferase NeuD family)
MSDLLLIWGAGEHGKVILDIARSAGRFARIAFLDDERTRIGTTFCECDVVSGVEELKRFAGNAVVIAVGDNRNRARCFDCAVASGLLPTTLIHPTAMVSPSARIGHGTVVMPGAIINACAFVGDNCIVNSGAIVEHDCRIAEHVHVSPGAVLGGDVKIGALAHIGLGAVVLPGARVGAESIVGAGAVVLKEVPARCTVAGVPAKVLKKE